MRHRNKKIILLIIVSSLLSFSAVQAKNFNIYNAADVNQPYFSVNGISGNVGVGTTNPQHPLDVVGYIRSSQGYKFAGSTNGQFTISAGNTYFDYEGGFNFRSLPSYSSSLMLLNNGNVGIGASNPTSKLQVPTGVISGLGGTFTGLGSAGNVVVMADNTGGLYSTSSASFISGNSLDLWKGTKNGNIWNGDAGVGNVGVGTTAPNDKLEVIGGNVSVAINQWYGSRFNGQATFRPMLGFDSTNVILRGIATGDGIDFQSSIGTSLMHIKEGGNVGIGTNVPNSLLTVGFSGSLSTNIIPTLRVQGLSVQDGTGNAYGSYGGMVLNSINAYTASARRFLITNALNANKFAIVRSVDSQTDPTLGVLGAVTSGTADFVIDNTGNVGIGTTNPLFRLDVRGIGGGYIQNFMGVMAGEGFSDKGMIGVFYDRNELTNAAYRGTSTITILNGGNFTDTPANKNLMVDASGSFMNIDSLTVNSIVEIKFELPISVSNYGRGVWQPFFQTRSNAAEGSTASFPRSIVAEVSNDGVIWYKPASGWSTTDFINNSFGGLWMAVEGSPTTPADLPGWQWKFARFTLSNFSVGTSYGLWLAELGVRHVSAPAARQFVYATGGTMYGGLNVMNGNVGIGTTNPTSKLQVPTGVISGLGGTFTGLGSAGNVVVMADNTGGLYSTSTASFISGNSLDLWKGTKNGNIWNGDAGVGNVGIGTTTPGAKLEVVGSVLLPSAATIQFGTAWNTGTLDFKNGATTAVKIDVPNNRMVNNLGKYLTQSSSVSQFGTLDNYATTFITNNTEKVRIDTAGNVGIGTTNPGANLQISGTNPSQIIRPTNANGVSSLIFDTTHTGGGAPINIIFQENAVDKWSTYYSTAGDFYGIKRGADAWNSPIFVLNDVGNVGIGTTNPTSKLQVPTGVISGLGGTFTGLGSAGNVVVMADNTGGLYSTSSASFISGNSLDLWKGTKNGNIWNGDAGVGNVGIGTTNPAALLSLGTAALNNVVKLAVYDGGVATDMYGLGVSGGSLDFYAQGPSANGPKMVLKSGNLGIGTTNPQTSLQISKSTGAVLRLDTATAAGSNASPLKTTLRFNGYANALRAEVVSEDRASSVANYSNLYFNLIDSSAVAQTRMFIDGPSGNIGIGTTNPGALLQINKLNGNTNTGLVVYGGDGGSGTNIVNFYDWNGNLALGISGNKNATLGGSLTVQGTGNSSIAGNVGIGTTNPTSKLQVPTGVISGLGGTFTGLGSAGNVVVMADNTGGLYSTSSASFISGNSLDLWKGTKNGNIWNGDAGVGNVGIGTTAPLSKLSISDTIYPAIQFESQYDFSGNRNWGFKLNSFGSGNWGGLGIFQSTGQQGDAFAGVSRLGIDIAGNVGIGTTIPGVKLDVAGDVRASAGVYAAGASGFYSSTYVVAARNPIWRFANADGYGVSYFQGSAGIGNLDTIGFHFGTATATSSLLQINQNGTITTSGNVGVGTTNPGVKLEIVGGNVKVANNQQLIFGDSGAANGFTIGSIGATNAMLINQVNNASLTIQTGGTGNIALMPGGNVGIGTTNPTSKLQVPTGVISGLGGTFTGLGSAGNVVVMADNTGGLYSTSTTSFISGNSLDLWKGTKNGNIWNGDAGVGNVGVGTTAPNDKLEVIGGNVSVAINQWYGSRFNGQATFRPMLGFDSTNVILRGIATGDGIDFQSSIGTSLMHIKEGGNVGIGTTNPTAKLSLGSNLINTKLALYDDGTNRLGFGIQAGRFIFHLGSNTDRYSFYDADTLANEIMTIKGTGNVGIGTTNPTSKLQVPTGVISGLGGTFTGLGSAGNVVVMADNTGGLYSTSSASFISGNSLDLWKGTKNGNIWNGDAGVGNVGIGTTNPGRTLEVNGLSLFNSDIYTTPNNGIFFSGTGSYAAGIAGANSGNDLRLFAGNAEKVRITNLGNVGIGTINPGGRLHVAVTKTNNGTIINEVGDYADSAIIGSNASTNNGDKIPLVFNIGSATNPHISSVIEAGREANNWNTYLAFYTNNITSGTEGIDAIQEKVRITSDGNVGIGTTIPTAPLEIPGASAVTGQYILQVLGNSSLNFFGNNDANSSYLIEQRGTSYSVGGLGVVTYPAIRFGFQKEGSWNLSGGGTGINGSFIVQTSSGGGTGAGQLPTISEKFRITGVGNVGIGTTNPTSKLQVPTGVISGLGGAFTGLGAAGNVVVMADNTGGLYSTSTASFISANNLDLWKGTKNGTIYNGDAGVGNVGIGTTGPRASLDVMGDILQDWNSNRFIGMQYSNGLQQKIGMRFFGTGRQVDIFSASGDGGNGITFTTSNPADYPTINLLERMRITMSGNVGIGTTDPGNYKLNVNGYFKSNGFDDGAVYPYTKTIINDADAGNIYLRAGSTGATWSKISIGGASHADVGIKLYTAGTERMTILQSGNVGIGTTNPTSKLQVPTGVISGLGGTFSGLGGGGGVLVMADNNGGLYATSTAGFSGGGAYLPLTGGGLSGALNMGGNDISNVNKLTVNTIDPLYQIQGVNYSTFAASIAGGVKEEYIGRVKINKQTDDGEREYVIDFNNVSVGSDLWVWRKTVDFSEENVEVLLTPYGGFAQVYYKIEDNKLIFRSDKVTTISYRLSGRRVDWKSWPTRATNQTDKAGFVIE